LRLERAKDLLLRTTKLSKQVAAASGFQRFGVSEREKFYEGVSRAGRRNPKQISIYDGLNVIPIQKPETPVRKENKVSYNHTEVFIVRQELLVKAALIFPLAAVRQSN